MAQNLDEVKYDTQALAFGMYVVSLDVPWNQTRFMFEGFLIESQEQLDELAKYKFAIVSKRLSRAGLFSAPPKTEPAKRAPEKRPGNTITQRGASGSSAKSSNAGASSSNTSASNTNTKASSSSVKSANPAPSSAPQPSVGGLFSPLINAASSLNSLFVRRPKLRENYDPNALGKDNPQAVQVELKRLKDAHKIRNDFNQEDELASKKIVHYLTSASVHEEAKFAHIVNGELHDAVNLSFASDLNDVQLSMTVNVAKEAIEEVVDSVARNPEALQLVSKIKRLDEDSYRHAIEVSLLLVALGRELCLPKMDLIEVGLGGLLHDVGEIRPPKNTEPEKRIRYITKFKLYRDEHIKEGLEIAEKAKYSNIVKSMIAHHHEYYNGSGYPNGKKKNQIGLYANMLVVVDRYVSMTTGRSCEVPATPSKALGYLYNNKNILFHPDIVDKFIQLVGMYPVGTKVKLNTGDVAFVIKQSATRKLLPIIMIVLDKHGKRLEKPMHVDLAEINADARKHIKIAKELPEDAYGVYAEDYFGPQRY